MARWVLTALGCLALGTGCLLSPDDRETGPRDLLLPDDVPEETGPPPGPAPARGDATK